MVTIKDRLGDTELVTGPSKEPITTAEAKTHERVDTSAEDDMIDGLIAAIREWAENETGQVFITQTWRYYLDRFPSRDRIILPKPPLQSVSSVKYTEDDDTVNTLASSSYRVNTFSPKGEIVLKDGETWPTDTLKSVNGVEVEFVAGFGDDASDVPTSIRQAIKIMVGHLYEHREAVTTEGVIPRVVPMSVMSLLATEKRFTFV